MDKAIVLFYIVIGAVIQGVGMALFLFPHHIPSGGAAGIAILFDHFWNIPYGWTLWMINIPLLCLTIHKLGKKTACKTILAVTCTALVVQLLSGLQGTSILWLDLGIGAIAFGIGVGILFRQGTSSGGMAILAHLLSVWLDKSPGKMMFFINSFIFIWTSVVLDWRIIIFAFIAQWISTRIIDIVYRFQPGYLKQKKALQS